MKEVKKITEFGETLNKALKTPANYVWKNSAGEEVKLIDMSPATLQKVYKHVNEMLYNKSKKTPGKYQVKENIQHYINNCNAELFMRYLLYECNIDTLKTNLQIIDFLRNNKRVNKLENSDLITTVFTNAPREFESVTIGLLLDACLDRLGVINRKMLTDKFILSQGVWLTDAEKKELTEYDEDGNRRPWINVIKERLMLPVGTKLNLNSRGLSYNELRSILHLTEFPKLSNLPTSTLSLLKNKIFILLDCDVDFQIEKWTLLKKQIEEVADINNIKLSIPEFK